MVAVGLAAVYLYAAYTFYNDEAWTVVMVVLLVVAVALLARRRR
jgi:MYXO-CTERM domain-containing protein